MCEEQLGLVTMRHQVPGSTGVIPAPRLSRHMGYFQTTVGKLVTGRALRRESACCDEFTTG